MRRDRDEAVAVAIHDVEPATYTRAALIRDWLDDHGIDRVTLLVVPAPDLHPFSTSSPELAEWLLERADRGDAIAQHGLTCRGTEFARLGHEEARRAVDSGRRLLKLAGVEPLGFVAPGYAYTPVLRATVRERYAWWADLMRLHRAAGRDRSRRPSGSRRWRCAPARCWAARSCASTCARPTSTTRATCSRSSACCAARGGARPSPTTSSRPPSSP